MSIKISEQYKDQLKQIHSGGKKMGWGLEPPAKLLEMIDTHNPKSILDYGCGSGAMMEHMKSLYPQNEFIGYDPGMPQFQNYPENVDLIYSTDVLEHVEPEHIESTLRQLWKTADINYHKIACYPAKKKLPDGRNAHLIIEEPEWWQSKINSTLDNDYEIIYNKTIIETKKKRVNKHYEVIVKRK